MKKIFIIAGIVSGLTFGPSSVFAADGKVNFTGEILDAGCAVTNDTSSSLVVNLGEVVKSSFLAAGTTAGAVPFTLQLTNCPKSITGASIKFDGLSDTSDSSILGLTPGTGVATGIGIQITDNGNTVIPLSSESKAYPVNAATEVATLSFVARYIATAATVTPGTANATASFTVIYN